MELTQGLKRGTVEQIFILAKYNGAGSGMADNLMHHVRGLLKGL